MANPYSTVIAAGIRRTKDGIKVSVRAAEQYASQMFPVDTPLETLKAWRRDARARLVSTARRGWRDSIPPADTPYLYFIGDGTYVKIGIAGNPEHRLIELQCGQPRDLTILAVLPCRHAARLERLVHGAMTDHRARGEWFRLAPEVRRLIRAVKSGEATERRLFDEPDFLIGTVAATQAASTAAVARPIR
jgi:hypothetical protein